MSEQSIEIGKLATALAKAQGKITGALKDSSNPFFKSKYADLAACWDACRTQLSENGLAVIQTTDLDAEGVTVFTTLAHESGEWMRGKLRMLPKDSSPQAYGSCLTYARRYALAAIVGLAQVDDDANEASGKSVDSKGVPYDKAKIASPKPEGWKTQDTRKVNEYRDRIIGAINDGKDVLEIWNEVKADHEFATALWTVLPSQIKSFIKDEQAKRG